MHLLEADLVVQCVDVRRVLRFADGIFGQQDFVDAFHRGQTFGDGVGCLGEIFERLDHAVENHHVEDERRGVDGTVVGENQGAAVPKHEYNEAGAEKLADGVCRTLASGDVCVDVAKLVGGGIEALLHLFLSTKGFDDAHTPQCFLELRHGFAPFGLCFVARLLEAPTDFAHGPTQSGENDEGEERELPRNVEETAEVDGDENGILDEHLQAAHDGILHFAHVAAHTGDDVTFALVAEEGKRERGDFLIQCVADVAHNAGAHRYHCGDRGEVARGFEECGGDEKHADHQQRGCRAVLCHKLRGVVVGIVDGDVRKCFPRRGPRDEMVDRLLGIEQQFEHRYERCERKYVEQRAQYVECQRRGDIALVRADIAAEHIEEFLH